MKKLSILIVAILMLGCETETPVVEEPLSIIEAPSPVAASGEPIIEAPSPVAASGEHFRVDIDEPVIHWANVLDGDADVDPAIPPAESLCFRRHNCSMIMMEFDSFSGFSQYLVF